MLWHKLIGFAIVSLALTQLEFVVSDIPAPGCRDKFSPVAGKCLYASRVSFNWFEGDRYCRSLDAGLLTLQNETQLKPISQYLNATVPWIAQFWTSGNTLGQKGVYYWQSTGELARFLPWSLYQPVAANGDCLTLDANIFTDTGYENFRLSIRNCTMYAPVVCEQQTQNYASRICLKPGSYEYAQVLA